MKVPEVCYDCVVLKMNKYANNNFLEEEKREKFLKEATKEVKHYFDLGEANVLEAAWERVARKHLNNYDAHEKEKALYQNTILNMKDDIEKLLDESDNELEDALKFAIAGNIIDFSTQVELSFEAVKEMIDKVKKNNLDEELLSKFFEDLKNAKEVVILLDNVGEVVFDYILVKRILKYYPNINITIVPSSYPISSDATVKEAYEVGFAKYAKIIPTGNDITGTHLPECSKECLDALDKADVVISKGMANFECLIGQKYNTYYFFLCKCALYADLLGVDMFTQMFLSDKYNKVEFLKKTNWE